MERQRGRKSGQQDGTIGQGRYSNPRGDSLRCPCSSLLLQAALASAGGFAAASAGGRPEWELDVPFLLRVILAPMPRLGGSARDRSAVVRPHFDRACSPECSRPTWSDRSSKSPDAPSNASVCCRPVSSSTTCWACRFFPSVRTKRSCACWWRVSRGKRAGPTSGTCPPRRRSSRQGSPRPRALEALFRDCAVPLATKRTKGAYYKRWRLMSLDGTCLDVADTVANEAAFGRPGSKRENSFGAFPRSGSSASLNAAPTPSSTPSSASTTRPSSVSCPLCSAPSCRPCWCWPTAGSSASICGNAPRRREPICVADQVQPYLGRATASRRRLVPLFDLPESSRSPA